VKQAKPPFMSKLVACILCTEELDKSVESVNGPWRESIVPGQCRPFERHRKDMTQDCIVIGV